MEDIQELKNQIAELQAKIEKLENKEKENKRWRAKRGEPYYYINGKGGFNTFNELYDTFDDYRYKTRNYFKTEQELVEYDEKVNTYYELMDFAEELSKDNLVDWKNFYQKKYRIYYDFEDDNLLQDWYYYTREIGQIYCTDEEFKEKAIAKFSEEKIKKLFI